MSKEKVWTELEVQFALFSWLERRGRTLILPNFIPYKWHECDVFSLTRSLYFHEIEIKVSRSDFLADFNKRVKHDALNGGERYGEYYQKGMPRTFCYACPQGLLAVNEIPEYAGLLYVRRDHDIIIAKKSPRLPAQKMSVEQVFKITNNLWSRYAKAWKDKAELIMANRAGPYPIPQTRLSIIDTLATHI